jgi:hypothetical protein
MCGPKWTNEIFDYEKRSAEHPTDKFKFKTFFITTVVLKYLTFKTNMYSILKVMLSITLKYQS